MVKCLDTNVAVDAVVDEVDNPSAFNTFPKDLLMEIFGDEEDYAGLSGIEKERDQCEPEWEPDVKVAQTIRNMMENQFEGNINSLAADANLSYMHAGYGLPASRSNLASSCTFDMYGPGKENTEAVAQTFIHDPSNRVLAKKGSFDGKRCRKRRESLIDKAARSQASSFMHIPPYDQPQPQCHQPHPALGIVSDMMRYPNPEETSGIENLTSGIENLTCEAFESRLFGLHVAPNAPSENHNEYDPHALNFTAPIAATKRHRKRESLIDKAVRNRRKQQFKQQCQQIQQPPFPPVPTGTFCSCGGGGGFHQSRFCMFCGGAFAALPR